MNNKGLAEGVTSQEISREYRTRTGDFPDRSGRSDRSNFLVEVTGVLSNLKLLDRVRRSSSKETAVAKLWRAKVENIGVEPTTSCMPCKRSSQLS